MRVVTLCGSLHPASTNAIVLGELTERLRRTGVEVGRIDNGGDLPAFRPHEADDPPAAVAAVRREFERADAIVFSIPEYAGGAPGWVKNITDWMVGSASLHERPVAVVSSSTTGGSHAIRDLARSLSWQGAHVIATCSISAPLTKTNTGHVTHAGTIAELDRVAALVVEAIRSGPDRVIQLAADALEPLDIDQFDRHP